MMKQLFTSIMILFCAIQTFAFETLSPSSEISVLIVSPGEPIYSQFGHAAFYVHDEENNIDETFDYGTFYLDNLPLFVKNMATGHMNYCVGICPFRYTQMMYQYEGRDIEQFHLNLTQEQKQQIYDFLSWNALPENRTYTYNFFEDNCATKIRDILEKTLSKLSWNSAEQPNTWRETIRNYVGQTAWISYGIHLGLGLPADTILSARQLMFIPDFVAQNLFRATVGDEKLCSHSTTILNNEFHLTCPWWNNSLIILCILAIIIAAESIREWRENTHCWWIDGTVFILFGLVASLIWFISFCSIHSLVFPNCNTLWLTPLHLIFGILCFIPRCHRIVSYYFLFEVGMIFIYITVSLIVGQFIPLASIPLFFIIFIRTGLTSFQQSFIRIKKPDTNIKIQ